MKTLIYIVTLLVLCQISIIHARGRGETVHLSHKDRKMIINYFNDIRRDLYAADMQELKWFHSAANQARRWGRQCVYTKKWENQYSTTLFKQPYDPTARPGEIVMDAIRSWAKQMRNYTSSGWKNCKRRNTCDYLQIIKSKLENVACSVSRCPQIYGRSHQVETDMNLVVCFFAPKFNIHIDEPYRPGKRCSYCPEGMICRKRMCSKPRIAKSSVRVSFGKGKNRFNLPKNSSRLLKQKQRWTDVKTISVYGKFAPLHRRITSNRISPGDVSIKEPYGVALKDRYLDKNGQIRLKKERKYFDQMQEKPNKIATEKASRVKRQARYYDNYEYERRRRQQEIERRRYQQRLEEQRRRRLREQRERERRRRLYNDRYDNSPARYVQPGPMASTDKYYLEQVHNTLRGNGMGNLKWDNYLERWAKYVIRCDIEYPGPIDCYTNFGKIPMESNAYNVVYDWGQEGTDVFQKLQYGCRTPADREKCNHNVIVRNEFLRKVGCAAMPCGRMKQLTCIYK